MKKPKKIFYSEDHLWVMPKGKNTVLVGITEHLISDKDIEKITIDGDENSILYVGDVVGEIITKDDDSIEIILPVSGRLKKINREVIENPEIILDDPYKQGWLMEIELDQDLSSFSLLTPEEYKQLVEET
ncbi:Glycine cleavage system H protein [bacterium HR19]|nr:Glycine cleavage system H protein [bacterium HR19]